VLADNRYGKSGIRLVRVVRADDRHQVADLTVDVRLQGDFAAAHIRGENANVLPTDTMRGTVYAFAGERGVGEPEDFARALAEHFVGVSQAIASAEVSVVVEPWERIDVDGGPHRHAFRRPGGGKRVTTVVHGPDGTQIASGVIGVEVLKTTGSAFTGYLRDRYTTLPPAEDRILATEMTATWRFATLDVDWATSARETRRVLLETFATHDASQSVQHTLYVMGEAALAERAEIEQIHLHMPNKHHLLVDLSPYGLDNPDEVFVAADRPFGVIEATVSRR
jgi:urate oxidase